jgi:hypothetical protein
MALLSLHYAFQQSIQFDSLKGAVIVIKYLQHPSKPYPQTANLVTHQQLPSLPDRHSSCKAG